MNDNIDSFFSTENPEADPVKRFELMKIMVKTKTIEYCTKKNRIFKARELKLINAVDRLNKIIIEGDHNIENLNLLEKSKKELEIIRLNRTKGAIVRSRAKHIEEGEKIVSIS